MQAIKRYIKQLSQLESMRKKLKILLTSSSLFMLAGGLFGPLYAVFVEDIGGDLLTAGSAYAAFSVAAGILIFLISRWEDRVKHQEKLIIAGYVLSCLGYLGYIFVQSPFQLFAIQIVFGVGEAIGTPAYDGLYSSSWRRESSSQNGGYGSPCIISSQASQLQSEVCSQAYTDSGFSSLSCSLFR